MKIMKMMRKGVFTLAVVLTLSGSVMFTSCIGSFGLSNRVLSWNQSLGNKWVNEVVFLALWIIPVYQISMFADMIVLNSIEFWTGSNPVAQGIIKEVQGENGNFLVETTENGYEITNEEGEKMSLIYDKDTNTWSSVIGDYVTPLVKIDGETATIFINGTEKSIELNEKGLFALRQEVKNVMLIAAK